MDAGTLPWGSPVFDVFKGLFPFLRLARLLHQGTMCDLKLAMCGAPDDVLVYAHSYFLALAADRTGDREFPAHEHVSLLFMIRNWKRDVGSAIRARPTHIGTLPWPRPGYPTRSRLYWRPCHPAQAHGESQEGAARSSHRDCAALRERSPTTSPCARDFSFTVGRAGDITCALILERSTIMASMTRTVLMYIIGPIIFAVIVFGALRIFNPAHSYPRTIVSDVVQGVLVGAGLSFITVLLILPNFYVTKVNGWTTMLGCGEPGSGILLRAACNVTFMGPINVAQEAMYWTTGNDGAGHTLSGAHDYRLHFAAGQVPPNNAFWSLTMGDAGNLLLAAPREWYL